MKGHIASSISYLNIGGLYYSTNWYVFCYSSLETIKFATQITKMNLYSVGETDQTTADNFLKRANAYMAHYVTNFVPAVLIQKKDSFLILDKEEGFYKILYGGKIGYIQALSLFKLRESIERI